MSSVVALQRNILLVSPCISNGESDCGGALHCTTCPIWMKLMQHAARAAGCISCTTFQFSWRFKMTCAELTKYHCIILTVLQVRICHPVGKSSCVDWNNVYVGILLVSPQVYKHRTEFGPMLNFKQLSNERGNNKNHNDFRHLYGSDIPIRATIIFIKGTFLVNWLTS